MSSVSPLKDERAIVFLLREDFSKIDHRKIKFSREEGGKKTLGEVGCSRSKRDARCDNQLGVRGRECAREKFPTNLSGGKLSL